MDNVENVENTENETNPIQDLIKASLDKDYNHANKIFGEVMTIKMSDLLDQEKVKMADQVYNGAEQDPEVDPELNDEEETEEDSESEETEEESEAEAEAEDDEEEVEGNPV
tara:strand:- start:93 stop:425 length:333 start_codon:yes stop_codon:yes gene_type:complete